VDRLQGTDERSLRVRVREASDGDALTVHRVEVTVALSDAPALRITRLTVSKAFWALVGFTPTVTTTDRDLERIALIESRETVRVRAAVSAGLGAVVRELLLAHPEASLEASEGSLVVGLHAGEGCTDRAIDFATRAARAIEATRIRPVEREAAVRCGFCHDDTDAPAEPVVRCDRCAATVHEDCWRANEGCPVLGCGGAAR
jgi:hypothetical protein